jgi:3-oxoacyl-[acyl-carrier protein] reductase
MTQRLAVELGPSGVRVNCLRAHLIADAPSNGSYTGELIRRRAAAAGISPRQWLGRWQQDVTLLGRLPTLAKSPMRRSSWHRIAPMRSPARWST